MTENRNILDYQKAQNEFLDGLIPDDFRNPSSFNQAQAIIESLKRNILQRKEQNQEIDNFILKAAENLFRQNSPQVDKLIALSKKMAVPVPDLL